jgi:hypothetical protein
LSHYLGLTKAPAFDTEQVRKVLDKIDTSNEVGGAAGLGLVDNTLYVANSFADTIST